MKKILLFLVFVTVSYSQVYTRTSSWALPQWGTGDTLKAGAKNTTPLSNYSLNNAFARIDAIGSVQIDSSGLFRSLYGRGSGNLTIDAGSEGASAVRVVLNDSLYGTTNWQTTANLLVGGNTTVGGYITADSLVSTGNLWFGGNVGIGGSLTVYASGMNNYIGGETGMDSAYATYLLATGSPSVQNGLLRFYNNLSNRYVDVVTPSVVSVSNKTQTLQNANGTIALLTGNDSLQAPTVHAVLFNSQQVAGTTLNDTSALFSDWSSNSTTEYPIVRLKYLHKAGITSIVARYYAYIGGGGDNWEAKTTVGTLSSSTTSGSNSSYGSMSTTTLTVSGLTANTLYDLQFKIGINTLGTSHFKELVITAESN